MILNKSHIKDQELLKVLELISQGVKEGKVHPEDKLEKFKESVSRNKKALQAWRNKR